MYVDLYSIQYCLPIPYPQYLLGGLSSIDVEDWRKNTDLVGYSPYDNVIVWFWKVSTSLCTCMYIPLGLHHTVPQCTVDSLVSTCPVSLVMIHIYIPSRQWRIMIMRCEQGYCSL